MPVRKILQIGNPLLKKQALPIPENELSSKEVKKIIRDLYDTKKAADGIGIAAPQIGILKQVIVVGYEKDKCKRYPNLQESCMDHVLINPKIEILNENKGNGSGDFWEGCLSVPNIRGVIERPLEIKISYYDEKENFHQEIVRDFRARVYQHECDHLRGILIMNHIKSSHQLCFQEEYK